MGRFVKFPFRQSFCSGKARLITTFLFVFLGVPMFAQVAPLPKDPEPREPKISGRVPDELIIRFKPGATEEKKSKALKKAKGVARDLIRPGTGRMIAADKGAAAAEGLKAFKAQGNVDEAKAALEKDPDVLYVEPNYKTRVFIAPIIPDDFEFESLYGLYNTGANGGKAGADIHATEAWEITKGSRDIIVAVVDTGIDYFHEDLRSNIWVNTREIPGNGIDDDGNGYVDDVYGFDFVSNDNDPFDDHFHGTHVSGTIGAMGNNGLGVVGVNWNVRLMAVKAFDEQGGGTVSSAIAGIHYAVVNGARIINCSWGSEDRSRALSDAIAEAQAAGIIVVAAAGNSRTDTPFFPAGYDGVISVASVNNKDQRSGFSNYGPHVAVSAPGEQILSTVPDSKYDMVSGTSMAAPHVSGVAALVLSRHPEFTPFQVATILKNTADPVAAGDRPIGRGRVNAYEAVKIELPLPNATLQVAPVLYGPAEFRGTASGEHFQSYTLFHGEGAQPTNWVQFASSTTSVTNSLLFSGFDTSTLNDGTHTFKLVVYNDNGQFASELVTVKILNVRITSPLSSDIFRSAEPLVIRGTVFGQGRHYGVEWSQGMTQTTWHTEGITVPSNGEVVNGILATFDTSLINSNEFYSFRISATNSSGEVQRHYANFVWLDSRLRKGWPVYLPFNGAYSFDDWRQAKVADLDGDGHKEILIVDHGNSDGKIAKLLVYHDDGTLAWSRELNAQEPYTDVPTVGDMDGDGKLEVFVDVGSTLYAFTYDGKDYPGLWPLTLTANRLGKIIADLDGDGKPELIALANSTPTSFGGNLTVYNKDGLILQRWDITACAPTTTNSNQRIFPVAANMDDQPDLEIVTLSGCNGVSMFKFNQPDPVWYAPLVGSAMVSPIVADVDHDGFNDIVVATYSQFKGSSAGVYLLDRFGQTAPGWPVLVDDSIETPIAVGDLDGDGKLEIVAAGALSYKLHVLEYDGFEAQGWPVSIDHFTTTGTPTIGDLDGDGVPEVLYTAPGYMELALGDNDPKYVGGISVWRNTGLPLTLSGRFAAIPMEGVPTPGYFKASPVTITDLDGNGILDLVCASIRDAAYAPLDQESAYKDRSSLYVFELNAPSRHGLPDWPEFQHGADNNGFLPTAPPPPAPPQILPIPEEIVAVGQAFTPVPLDQFLLFSGPRIPGLQWTATGQAQLSVNIGPDHVASISAPPLWEGSEEITFTVSDGKSFNISTKTRFTARAGYFPPVATPDRASLNEDEALVIDVLANDVNPAGGALTLLDVTKPSHGTALITPDAKILYTPDTNYNGLDSFTYYIANASGARGAGLVSITIAPINDPPIARDDRALTFEDHAVVIDALANDSDPDGDPLQILSIGQPLNGITTITPDKKIKFQPRTDYNGTSVFSYTISDGISPPQTASITVVVRPLNSAPVAKGQDLVMNRNTTKDIIYLADDIDGDALTFRIVQPPQHGELFSYPTVGSYIPKKGFSGVDSFTYKASDGFLESAEALVRITILDTNNPPTIPGLTVVTRINQSAPVLLQASDADDDPVTFRIAQNPSHGTLSGSGTNYVFTPDRDYFGSDYFLVGVSDGQSETIGRVTLQTTDKNTAPGANPKLVKTTPNTPVSITLTGADSESDPLTFVLTSLTKHGVVTGAPPNVIYTPDMNYFGPDRFRFTVSDREFTSDPAAVTIAVAPKNTVPYASNQVVVATKAGPISMRLNVRDAEGDPLQCVILKGPRAGTIAGVGTDFVFTPGAGFGGVDVFTYKAWDGHNFGNEATVRIEQSIQPPPPAPPVFNGIQISAVGIFQLSLTNQVGQNFRLESSLDLTNWTTLTNMTSPGTIFFSAPITNSQIFFRAVDE